MSTDYQSSQVISLIMDVYRLALKVNRELFPYFISTRAPCPGTGTSLNRFSPVPAYLLSHKLLKHQLQICYRFLDSQDLFLVVCEHTRSRALGSLNKVHFSARVWAPSLNGALDTLNLGVSYVTGHISKSKPIRDCFVWRTLLNRM